MCCEYKWFLMIIGNLIWLCIVYYGGILFLNVFNENCD